MDDHSGDRTEAATPHRLQTAREQGDMPLSRELSLLAMLGCATLSVMLVAPRAAHRLGIVLAAFLAHADTFDVSDHGAAALRMAFLAGARAVAPIAGFAAAGAIAGTLLQSGFTPNTKALMPNGSRVDPRKGITRIFSAGSLVEAVKSIAKIGIAAIICWRVISGQIGALAAAPSWPASLLLDRTMRATLQIVLALLALQAVAAVLDVLWVRFRHARQLRMTREEVREEMKELDGNPQVKGRLRQLRHQRARRRMMGAVRAATVVVTNPTHYAVALAYDRTRNAAPRVVAKGVDSLAARIREEAERHRVPLVANPPLARALYRVELDADIPAEHYQAAAELIAYVWRLQGRLRPRAAA